MSEYSKSKIKKTQSNSLIRPHVIHFEIQKRGRLFDFHNVDKEHPTHRRFHHSRSLFDRLTTLKTHNQFTLFDQTKVKFQPTFFHLNISPKSQSWQKLKAMAPSKTNSHSNSSNRNGEVRQANVLASSYIVDASARLTGFHYSTTGAGGAQWFP